MQPYQMAARQALDARFDRGQQPVVTPVAIPVVTAQHELYKLSDVCKTLPIPGSPNGGRSVKSVTNWFKRGGYIGIELKEGTHYLKQGDAWFLTKAGLDNVREISSHVNTVKGRTCKREKAESIAEVDETAIVVSKAIQPFAFEGFEVRFVGTPDVPEWVATDVVNILYPDAVKNKNQSTYLAKIPDEWKGSKKFATFGSQAMTTLYEPGLYALIARSNSPMAIPFQKWVYEEVLPSIRKTGRYEINQPSSSGDSLAVINAKARLAELEAEKIRTEHNYIAFRHSIVTTMDRYQAYQALGVQVITESDMVEVASCLL